MPKRPSDLDQPKGLSLPDGLIEAVAFLRLPSSGTVPSANESETLARTVLSRAELRTGILPDQTQVFVNMHAFAVRAPQPFLDALSADHDVDRLDGNDPAENG